MFYFFVRGIVLVLVYLLFRPKISGKENIPKKGSLIIYSNHTSWMDPAILGYVVPRRIYFMAKEELFEIPFLGWLIKRLGAFPVKRNSPDIGAIKRSLKILKEGKVFGIFPEGTRSKSGELQKFNHGMASIALRSESSTIPIVITGGYHIFKPIRIKIGEPINYSEIYGRRTNTEVLDEVSDLMEQAIESLKKDN